MNQHLKKQIPVLLIGSFLLWGLWSASYGIYLQVPQFLHDQSNDSMASVERLDGIADHHAPLLTNLGSLLNAEVAETKKPDHHADLAFGDPKALSAQHYIDPGLICVSGTPFLHADNNLYLRDCQFII